VNILHGKESVVEICGDRVFKSPKEEMSVHKKEVWLSKQYVAKDSLEEIKAKSETHGLYGVPVVLNIDDADCRVTEEFVLGVPLSSEVFACLPKNKQMSVIEGIARFLVDMNELKPINGEDGHRIAEEIKLEELASFIDNKMGCFFDSKSVTYMGGLLKRIQDINTYDSQQVWSHNDLNLNNVLYDTATSKLSFVDFAEVKYNFVYHDIFSPLEMDLKIFEPVYKSYINFRHTKGRGLHALDSRQIMIIMIYRKMIILLKRFMHEAKELRLSPCSEHGVQNTLCKVENMKRLITEMRLCEVGKVY